ncbi:hypothetical protein B0T24DRAFT_207196 [Lasiosphaeria ovina]|uniref:Uncharacterized protein n=1 Tax=Lasiosphaeria ovina TaxID=92902 RepID=A0AAE0KFG8_9PEZI|nr:hypothetical protein B0T24DRAFT_207196 [Lasiosphaeria ovina]
MKHILCNDKEEDMATRKLGGMSIQEKMLMWETSPLERRQEPVVSEYFEGVDDMDDHAGHPDFSTYSQTILNSKAYTWLVDSLLKESSFHWDDSKPKIMINNIRHEILNALPTGKISRKQSPCIYRAAFHIPWLAPMKRLERERTKNRTGTGEALGNIIVLTSSSEDQTQATRVEEYMTRTWSSGSSEILQVLKDAVGRKDYSFASAFLRDKTEIKAVLKRSTLVVEVAGPRRSIAECGEQLAWLTTALQDSNEEIATHHAPLLINQDVTHLPLGTQAPESCWKIEVAHRGRENVPNIAPLIATGWLGGRIKPVIARGFPTTRRPLGFSGVELSPKVLVSILCATESRWELVKKADGICLWHVLPSHEERCGCATISQPRFSTDIHDYRHIIDNCPKVHPSSGSSQLRPLQAVPDPNAPSHSREGLVVSPMASKGIFNAPTRVSLTESPATSMDPDMMSIPDSPEEFSLDPSGILLIVVRATARQLLDQYRTETSKASSKSDHGKSPPTTDGEPSDGTNSQGPSSNESYQNGGSSSTRSNVAGQSTDSSSQESAGPNLKRTRRDEDNEEDGDDKDRDRMPPPKKPKRGHDLPSGKTLACPFWKLDPNRHRDCLRREKFVQISRIKQHLARKHTPIYCERCKLILPNEDGHRKHHEQPGPGCVLKEWDPQHGISHQQQAVLHKKSRADLSTPEQWFAIWNLLFPEHARPSSPYIDQGLSDDFCNFREYVQQRGTQALVAQLQGQGISAPTSEPAMVSYLERVVSTGLDALIEDWLAMRMAPERSPNGNRNQDDHPRSETSDRETTGGSQTDSGVVLSSLTDLSSLNLAPQDGNMPTADMMPRFGELGVENYHLIGNHMPISDFHIPDSFGDMGLGGTWPGNFGDDMNFDAQLEDYLWDAFRDPTEDHQ